MFGLGPGPDAYLGLSQAQMLLGLAHHPAFNRGPGQGPIRQTPYSKSCTVTFGAGDDRLGEWILTDSLRYFQHQKPAKQTRAKPKAKPAKQAETGAMDALAAALDGLDDTRAPTLLHPSTVIVTPQNALVSDDQNVLVAVAIACK